jgi:hypothetical protein
VRHPILILILILSACGMPRENMVKLQPGMSVPEVINILGEPDGRSVQSGHDCLTYSFWRDFWNRVPGDYSDRYYTCFTVGKLTTFGKLGERF